MIESWFLICAIWCCHAIYRTSPNCKFLVVDAEEDWPFEDNAFDFVHARYLYPAITDWPRLWLQSFTCLKPGGWVEHQEDSAMFWSDDPGFENSRTKYFANQIEYASKKIGKNFRIAAEQKDRMEEVGFTNVVQKLCKVGRDPATSHYALLRGSL